MQKSISGKAIPIHEAFFDRIQQLPASNSVISREQRYQKNTQ